MRIYSVFDKVADEFGPVFQQPNDDSAKRAFKAQVVNVPFCNDLELFFIAEFDENDKFITIADAYIVDKGSYYEEEYKKLHPIRYVNEQTKKAMENQDPFTKSEDELHSLKGDKQ